MASEQSNPYELPYQPVPRSDRARILRPIQDALLQRRFPEDGIRPGFRFTIPKSEDGVKVHQATFTDRYQWDLTTSGVNFFYSPGNALSHPRINNALAVSGAPFNFIGDESSVTVYMVSRNGGIEWRSLEENVPYSEIPQVLAGYEDIAPTPIRRAKMGIEPFRRFPSVDARQLRLFAEDVTKETLVHHFKDAIDALRNSADSEHPSEREKIVAVQLLAAVILAHKGVLGEEYAEPDASRESVIQAACGRFKRFFAVQDLAAFDARVATAYRALQQVRYSSLTPDFLEHLYMSAYPASELRKREGPYCTPFYLTRRILENIPVETLHPSKRVVADMTCGIGSFLRAAYERLSHLTDMQQTRELLHESIFGNDMDQPTAQLARLSLLLASHSDQWGIHSEDALHWSWLSQHRPNMIVGNPPFFGSRKGGFKATVADPDTGKPTRYQSADTFVRRAIERLAPGGYLAMMVPRSFTVSQASPAARKLLLEMCDVLELWELPNEVFRGATVRPMVVFARRKQDSHAGRVSAWPVRVRTVQAEHLDDFKHHGIFTKSSVVWSQESWGADSSLGPRTTHVMDYDLILRPEEWLRIRGRTHRLDEIADITLGAGVGTKRLWKDHEDPKEVEWLSGAKRCMPRAYVIEYRGDTKIYPNDLERPRKNRRYPKLDKEWLLAGPKVLLVSNPDPSWGQRIKVAIERQGYYPSDGFWVLAPKRDQPDYVTLEVLAAVVSWHVSNAWILEHMKAPKIPSPALRSVPFPRGLSASSCRTLESAVRRLEDAANAGEDAPRARRAIDRVLRAAYELDDETLNRLREVALWDKKPPAPERNENGEGMVRVSGGVVAVDAREGALTLWLSGISGVHETPIHDRMPGWMLRPGMTFRAEVSKQVYRDGRFQDLGWGPIRPQEYTYLTEDQLLDRLTGILSDTSE